MRRMIPGIFTSVLAVGILLSFAALSLNAASAAPTKQAICHATGNGMHRLIQISEKAVQQHLSHGDGIPGEEVVGKNNYVFSEDCAQVYVDPAEEKQATLTIRKTTDIEGTDTIFTFRLDATLVESCTSATDPVLLQKDDSFTCSYDATADDSVRFVVSEEVASGFSLTSIDCGASVLADEDSIALNVSASSITFDLDPGDELDCTFHNSRDTGTVVIKSVVLDGDTSLDFSGFPGSFREHCSTTTIGPPDYEDIVCENVPTTLGDTLYLMTQLDGAGSLGFSLISVDCDDSNSLGDVSAKRAEIKLDKDETVTCTFTNMRDAGELRIVLQDTALSGEKFKFTTDLSFDNNCIPDRDPLNDGFELDWNNNTETCYYVPTWQYFTITQSPMDGWEAPEITCDGLASYEVQGSTVRVQLMGADFVVVTCTFTNTPISPP